MSFVAITLILSSALLHAMWNFLGKIQTSPGLYFYFYATAFSAIVLTLAVMVSVRPTLSELSQLSHWPWMLATGICQTIYLLGLAQAYKQLELSVAYPLIRAIPILMVPLISLLIFQETNSDNLSWWGYTLISLGTCLFIPFKHLSKKQHASGFGWILVSALGTCGYSIIDFEVQQQWLVDTSLSNNGLYKWQISLLYACALNWATTIIMFFTLRVGKIYLTTQQSSLSFQPLYAGLMITGSYLLVLIAMNYSSNISNVVAFRQISIPIGFLMGIFLIKETLNTAKLMGLICICCGLVVIA